MIVKVQTSLLTSEEFPQVMVYNKSQKYMYQGHSNKEVAKAMGDEPKKFFYAKVIKGNMYLKEEAPWQDW